LEKFSENIINALVDRVHDVIPSFYHKNFEIIKGIQKDFSKKIEK